MKFPSIICFSFNPFLLAIGFLILPFLAISTTNITTDHEALLALKPNMINNRELARNWSEASPVCEWMGVICGSRHHRVTALNLSTMNLTGEIPSQLGNLSFLTHLNLSRNNFRGGLPPDIARLRRLKYLDLRVNSLSGDLPSWFGSLKELRYLSLGNNSFTGAIPYGICNASQLETIYLSHNSLDGAIPTDIGNLLHLKKLAIEFNQLSGFIPLEIFNASSLEVVGLMSNRLSGSLPEDFCRRHKSITFFSVAVNMLSGQIPSGLFQCSQLQLLQLGDNSLSGFIPKEIGNLKVLQLLFLNNNNLTGEIPKEITNSTMLRYMILNDNILTGVIPEELGKLHRLEKIYLGFNSLSGTISIEIFNLSRLNVIQMLQNHLTGNLPSNLGDKLPNLESLNLGSNNLGGEIPHSISNSSKLTMLELSSNKFTGSISNNLGDLRLLEILNLGHNNLTIDSPEVELNFFTALTKCINLRILEINGNPLNGKLPNSVGNLSRSFEKIIVDNCKINGRIPNGFGNLSNLILLSLPQNELSGQLPATIAGMRKLQRIYLQNNRLSGVVSMDLCSLQELSEVYLDNNQFSGPIPDCLGFMTMLRKLYLSSNQFNSSLPTSMWNLKDLLQLNLHSNLLSGSIPLQIGNLKVVNHVDLSNNSFDGVIPSTFGDLQNLVDLSLTHNKLQGLIPYSIGNIKALEFLDISHNNLTGSIPKSMENLKYLKYFNVSFNKLTGEIPSRGPFEKFTGASFSFNEELCGLPKFKVPPCPALLTHSSRIKKVDKLLLIVLVVGMAIIASGVAVVVITCLKYPKKGKIQNKAYFSSATEHERFTYHQLLRATEGFNESNLLGRGSFGSVYQATFTDGRVLAIKVFNLLIERAVASFDIECQVLRNLRHRNLVKVISSCTNLDFRALILEFMPNGSLQRWLYFNNHFLDIQQRLNIMIDVASALHYLHQGYSTPIVHCDLKPSNILLDQEMVAHISDFGIAKLLGEENSITYTNMVGTTGYIAPEHGLEGLVSTKCDVYSYGIMLMEVFTRTTPINEMFDGNLTLKSWVTNHFPDSLHEIIDANLLVANEGCFTEKLTCVKSIIEMALNCSSEIPGERSHMGDVLASLVNIKFRLERYSIQTNEQQCQHAAGCNMQYQEARESARMESSGMQVEWTNMEQQSMDQSRINSVVLVSSISKHASYICTVRQLA